MRKLLIKILYVVENKYVELKWDVYLQNITKILTFQ